MKPVVVETVVTWVCPDCGARNLTGLVPVDATPDERTAALARHGMTETAESRSKPVGWRTPEEVECVECKQPYTVAGTVV